MNLKTLSQRLDAYNLWSIRCIRIMKTSILLLFISLFQLNATAVSAQDAVIKLKTGQMSVEQLLKEIEKQTDYLVIYRNNDIKTNREVLIQEQSGKVKSYLAEAFENTNITYQFEKKYILLTKEENKGFSKPSTQQRELKLSGTIVDAKGETIIGANVIVKGTSNGTITDLDGKFLLNVPKDAILTVSYIGYSDQEIAVKGRTSLNIILKEDLQALEEVVVIGYGTTSKRKMVGAVSSIKAEKIEETTFSNVGEAIQGQVPGLVVNNSGGLPGSTPTVSIRGAGTPLFVIDGVISDEYAFSTLNPEDIQSISFLKDASSTAVYGSRAGDGIVLIQTKRGKNGSIKLKYSNSLQISEPTILADKVSSAEWARTQNYAAAQSGDKPVYTDEEISKFANDDPFDGYPNSDVLALGLKDFAFGERHNVSLVGGTDLLNFYVSLGYMGQGGLFKSNSVDLNRYNFRSNLTVNLDKIGMKIGANVNANLQKKKEPEAGQESVWAYGSDPTCFLGLNEDGTYANYNFLSLTDAGPYLKTKQKYVDAQLKMDWDIPSVNGLTFHVMGNYKETDERIKDWDYVPLIYRNGQLDANSKTPPSLEMNYENNDWLDGEISFTYKNTLGKHGLEVLALYTARKNNMENMMAYRQNYMSNKVDQLFAGSSVGQNNSGSASELASAGYVGRLKYDYNSKYIAEFSFRYDGNDNFAKGKKWGFFPAFSAVWMMSDENFMENLRKKDIINYFKIRGSVGETGVTNGVSRFGYLPTYSLEANQYVIDGALSSAFYEGNLVDPMNLSWYTRKSYNIGFDFASLNNRLEGSLDYFFYRTTGFIVSPQNTYSTTLGKDLPKISSNSAHRRAGYEVTLRWKDNVGKLYYEIGGNMSYYNQLWEQKDDEAISSLMNPYIRETQQTDFFGQAYLNDGLYQNKENILHSSRLLSSTVTAPGDIQYKDMNGDGKIDTADKRRIGLPTLPHLNYGIDFSLKYDGWFMNGLIQGTGDRYCMLGGRYQRSDAYNIGRDFQLDYWTPENTDARFPRIAIDKNVNGGNNFQESDYFDINAKYVRLKSLQVGYDLKHKVLKNLNFISGCRISVIGTNLLTFSDVLDYFDPEAKMFTYLNANHSSTDGYPVMRTYSVNLSVEF